MTNPRVTALHRLQKLCLDFIDDKKATRTKKNLYTWLLMDDYIDIHAFTWSDRIDRAILLYRIVL